MKKVFSVLAIIVLAVGALIMLILRKNAKNNVVDGPGMVYEWTSYELYTDWIEITDYTPCRLHFNENELTFTDYEGKKIKYDYSLPEDVDSEGRPDGEVYLEIKDFDKFDSLIYHEEEIEGVGLVPVISGTLFELDGRGEIIVAEFVHTEDLERLPEGFRSASCIKRNDAEAPPTYIEVENKTE